MAARQPLASYRLEALCRETWPGEAVGAAGLAPALGAWQPAAALRLATSAEAFPLWRAEVPAGVPAGSEFKLVIMEPGGGTRWEPIAGNRHWPATLPSGGLVRVAFGDPASEVEEAADAPSGRFADPPPRAPRLPQLEPQQRRGSRLRERLINSNVDRDIQDCYDLARNLGEGAFGVVCKATCKKSKLKRAVKTVVKEAIPNVPDLVKEIELTRSMDHPNVVRLYESFEDARNIYLVMELCEGGELFDKIVEEGHLTEPQAATVAQQMLRAVCYMHQEGVCHRDLKPENFLFQSNGPIADSPLKLIDFGLSRRFAPGEELKTAVGTAFYVAPEVLSRGYGPPCDLWSIGTILYCLLSGRPPFRGRDDQEVLMRVRQGQFSVEGGGWDHVSDAAKEVIGLLLQLDPQKRASAQQALEHDWVKNLAADSGHHPLAGGLVDSLKAWRLENRFTRAARTVIASQMSDTDIQALRANFMEIDADSNGVLSYAEVKEGLRKTNLRVPPELAEILREMDTAGGGSVSYTEFLAAALDARAFAHEDMCWQAFRTFDKDGDGKITLQELAQLLDHDWRRLPGAAAGAEAAKTMKEFDKDSDGQVEFEEFVRMMGC